MIDIILKNPADIDATKQIVFLYSSIGLDVQSVKLIIKKQLNDEVVYQEEKATSEHSWKLPANTLKNTEAYNAQVYVFGLIGEAAYGAYSNKIQFKCFSTPILKFTNINENAVIKAEEYTFTFNYDQAEGVPIDKFQFELQDSQGAQIGATGDRTVLGGFPPYDGSFTIKRLESGKEYYVEIRAYTAASGTYESLRKKFSVTYTRPAITGNLILKNNCKSGRIDISGNIEYTALDAIKIKRRMAIGGEWLTIYYDKTLSGSSEKKIDLKDNLCASEIEYEYAIVGILNNIESEYIKTKVFSKFNGIFLVAGMGTENFKFMYATNYTANTFNRQDNIFAPLGKKYPVIVSNGLSEYQSGTVNGLIINDDNLRINANNFSDTREINRKETVERKKAFLSRIAGYRILKDWNSNIWLIKIVGAPSFSYVNDYGMGLLSAQFNWVEIGSSESQKDLYEAGLVPVIES